MRFEVGAAVVGGVLLPLLETVRRGIAHWAVEVTTMAEDYVTGALLLAAGLASTRSRPYAPVLLVTAWAYAAGLMGTSFWGHLEETLRGAEMEPNNAVVLAVKTLLWGTCIVALILSFRAAIGLRASASR